MNQATLTGEKIAHTKLVKLKGKMIHLRVKTDGGEKYLCNQQWGTAKPSKSTFTESLVTCHNCLRILRNKKSVNK